MDLELGLGGLDVAGLFVLFHAWGKRLEVFTWRSHSPDGIFKTRAKVTE